MSNSTIYEGVYTETTIEEETTMFGKAKDMFKSITGKGMEMAKKARALLFPAATVVSAAAGVFMGASTLGAVGITAITALVLFAILSMLTASERKMRNTVGLVLGAASWAAAIGFFFFGGFWFSLMVAMVLSIISSLVLYL